nr:RNA-directed DNA polymerase, eukaryota, reverse transcriptase zinc-binding domain protein [Tanacetum cinerariifolium]
MDGFDTFVIDVWGNIPSDKSNAMRNVMNKLKCLKVRIRGWLSRNRNRNSVEITRLKGELTTLDKSIDNGTGTKEIVCKRPEILNSIHNLKQIQATEAAQKAKIKCVKNQFFQHFKDRFDKPKEDRVRIDMCFPRSLSSEQQETLEYMVSMEEVKRAVWDCGTDKSPGPNCFSFGFYRHFWPMIRYEVFEAVKYFFTHNDIPNGCNSTFIGLIPKIFDANMVKDFRPISLIGSIYKIIANILAFIAERQILDGPFILNEVLHWCKSKKKQALFFKVDFEKAYDSVRWDFLDDVLLKLGFENKWRLWIQSCLRSSRGSIIVNGSPTEEFQFSKGLKQ